MAGFFYQVFILEVAVVSISHSRNYCCVVECSFGILLSQYY